LWQSCCVRGRAGRPDHEQQHDCHHDTKVKPEAATAVIELLMMGGKTPETCWAVNKRRDKKLENFLHLVGDLFELLHEVNLWPWNLIKLILLTATCTTYDVIAWTVTLWVCRWRQEIPAKVPCVCPVRITLTSASPTRTLYVQCLHVFDPMSRQLYWPTFYVTWQFALYTFFTNDKTKLSYCKNPELPHEPYTFQCII